MKCPKCGTKMYPRLSGMTCPECYYIVPWGAETT